MSLQMPIATGKSQRQLLKVHFLGTYKVLDQVFSLTQNCNNS